MLLAAILTTLATLFISRNAIHNYALEQAQTQQQESMSIASLVLGVVSLLAWLIPLIGLPVSIVGLVLGILGRHSRSRGMAMGGIVTSAIGLGLSLINAILGAIFSLRT